MSPEASIIFSIHVFRAMQYVPRQVVPVNVELCNKAPSGPPNQPTNASPRNVYEMTGWGSFFLSMWNINPDRLLPCAEYRFTGVHPNHL